MHESIAGLEPDEFVEDMKRKGIRVPGIGHRIKSKVCNLLNPRLSRLTQFTSHSSSWVGPMDGGVVAWVV